MSGKTGQTGRLGGRLRAVRKRKRARNGFACEVVTAKIRLVKIDGKEKNGR